MIFKALTTGIVALSGVAAIALWGVDARADDAPAAPAAYAQAVLTTVSSHIVYPRLAKARGEQGVVTLAITVDKGGAVANVAVVNSSGVASLDDAAVNAAKDGAPYPAQSGTTLVQGKVRFTP